MKEKTPAKLVDIVGERAKYFESCSRVALLRVDGINNAICKKLILILYSYKCLGKSCVSFVNCGSAHGATICINHMKRRGDYSVAVP